MEARRPIEIVDIEDDKFSTPILCRGSNKINPIPVEKYDGRDLHLAHMASLSKTPFGSSKINAISVEEYDEDRDLRRAIIASLSPSPNLIFDLNDDDDDLQVTGIKRAEKKPFRDRGVRIIELGESSKEKEPVAPPPPLPFMCEICTEPKPIKESFNIMGCSHNYCNECMIQYVASKLQENVTGIRCPVPDCNGVLEPEYCRSILPPEVFERWGNALCESVILGSEKFYCPFKDCSMLLINDVGSGESITQSECPYCNRLFCAQCKTTWHLGIDCAGFQALHKDERQREDILMMNLAKGNNWKRCPNCGFYVEKSQGCNYMKCRCGLAFCYNCRAPSTSASHLCSKCQH